MLLPVTTFEGSDKKLHSFIAALHLGLKKEFGGNIEHLQTAEHEEPVPDSTYRKKFLVLYDTVPGGTGYLKQLMRSEKPMLKVFETALATLNTCPCNQDPAKDGCYQCLFAYRRSHYMAGTSRETAKAMLSEILKYRDRWVPTDSLKGVQVNVLFDSELEARFVEALRGVRFNETPVKLVKELVNGKPGYFYQIAEKAYYIEPQANLGDAEGVKSPSKADFLIRPVGAQDDVKPIAVFTDGYFYHKNRIGADMSQRCAIAASGGFHVWSLSWKDIQNQYKKQSAYFENYLNFSEPGRFEKYVKLLECYDVSSLSKLKTKTAFEWLVDFLADPNASQWAAHAFVHGLLHLDDKRYADERAQRRWLEMLQLHLPEEVADVASSMDGLSLFGLYESETPPGFVKLFVAVNRETVRTGDYSKLYVACSLSDTQPEREHPEFESAWNGYLRLHNLFQFLPNVFFATLEGKTAGYSYHKPRERPEEERPEGDRAVEWSEIKFLVGPELHTLIDFLATAAIPIPEVGYELTNPGGEIIAQAELAWETERVVLLNAGEGRCQEAFVQQGWRVMRVEAALEAPAALLRMFE